MTAKGRRDPRLPHNLLRRRLSDRRITANLTEERIFPTARRRSSLFTVIIAYFVACPESLGGTPARLLGVR